MSFIGLPPEHSFDSFMRGKRVKWFRIILFQLWNVYHPINLSSLLHFVMLLCCQDWFQLIISTFYQFKDVNAFGYVTLVIDKVNTGKYTTDWTLNHQTKSGNAPLKLCFFYFSGSKRCKKSDVGPAHIWPNIWPETALPFLNTPLESNTLVFLRM